MTENDPIRIAFVLTELTLGGAEMMLWKLLSRIDRTRFDVSVVALSSRTDMMLQRFEAIGVPCKLLDMSSRADLPVLRRLAVTLGKLRPHIVQGWMYHGNAASTFASLLLRPQPAVLWNVRGTLNLSQEKWLSVCMIRFSGVISRLPTLIVNNSAASAEEHERCLGYPAAKRVVVPNGFDMQVFRPSQAARDALRQQLGLSPDTRLVGLIGRYHPMKDHATFIRAAALLSARQRGVHYVLAGDNIDSENSQLRQLIAESGLSNVVHLLGTREDMPQVTAALDVSTSSSCAGEGFPNVVGEAMSCGVPCVVTDVGDSASVVGDSGKIVPPQDPQALANALDEILATSEEERLALGRRARQRILHHFSLDAVVARYEKLYREVYAIAHPRQT